MAPESPEADSPSFRRFHVEAISEDRGAELDRIYGTGGGIDSALETFRYVGAGDADVSMRGAEVEGTRSGRMEPRADHIVFWVADGTASLEDTRDGTVLEVTPGHPLLLSASVAYTFSADIRKLTMVHLSDRVLRAELARRQRFVRGPLLFDQQPDIEVALGPLRAIIRSRAGQVMDGRLDEAQRAALNQQIAAAVIDAFPLVEGAEPEPSTAAARAAAWIRDNAGSPLELRDIATAVGLSERGLQSAMRRTYGESPMERLRAERLEGARRELVAGGAGTTVAETARRWHLTHLGRFAGAYAERFGEPPSVTLRRARAGARERVER
ncbi:helix-turn-helix transcriptional regulator [Curtobacterium sp. UCD-KPL2560]|uniref:helix-turn-helix transcriptional regulator n=1 Tax=Curtobacterium sp. UCD-KPL2560 TaxID=1885315 RepID=UPI0008259BDD|nr:helix-turn-helix transcriptional regulator [Curtobacterium sp. UCD-KPL2560]